ncbi:MAG: hypothetical protein ABID64_01035 [Nitrospirota bacterium]
MTDIVPLKEKTVNRGHIIKKWLEFPTFDVQFKLPRWAMLFILLLPVIAYGDMVFFGRRTFLGYLGVSALEVALIMLGYTIAIMEVKK